MTAKKAAAKEETLKIVCAHPTGGPDSKLTTTVGIVNRTEPLEVPKEEAERYIDRGIARVWVETKSEADAAQG